MKITIMPARDIIPISSLKLKSVIEIQTFQLYL
jgi:hypothetical protein